jgi:hypothetical protein
MNHPRAALRPPTTEEQALHIARAFASRQGWKWLEPARVISGRRLIAVVTTLDGRGRRVVVDVDIRTGRILYAAFDKP